MSSSGGNTTANSGTGDGGIVRIYYLCDQVGPSCPVQATTLGYFPNKGANIFFAVGFFACSVAALGIGTWKRTWSYMAFLTAGCFLEVAGYGGRAALAENPWNRKAFETQICAIVLGPTLACVSIYLTLKHATLALNPGLSRIRPRIYPFIFVPADVSCLLVQAIGGALAASASSGSGPPNMDLVQGGNRAIIAGISLQVVVLLTFGLTCADYYIRVKKLIASGGADVETTALWHDRKFRLFVYAVTGAYSTILIRCIYRIAEMAGGWGNHIMQDEPSFMVLDGGMILIACALLSFFAPGMLFPHMAESMNAPSSRKGEKAAAAVASGGEESQHVPAKTESTNVVPT